MRKLLSLILFLGFLAGIGWADRGPQLEAKKILVTGALTAGERVRVTVVIVNRGDAVAQGVSCSLNSNGVDWGTIGKGQELPAGQEMTLEESLTVPKGDLGPLSADGQPKMQARVGQFYLPDLAIEDVKVPENINQGEPTEIEVLIRNRGKGPAGGAQVELLVGGKPVEARRTIERLNEGDRERVVLTWIPVTEGKVELTAIIDRNQKVTEQDEGNNSKTVKVTVAAERASQLRVVSLVPEVHDPRAGSPVRLRLELMNNGELDVFRVPVVLLLNGQQVMAKTFYEQVRPKTPSELYLSYTPREGGKQTYTAILGKPGVKPEAGIKNSAMATVEVRGRAGYRLKVISMDTPARMTQGKDYILTAVVSNAGDMACGACKVSLLANGARVTTARSDLALNPGQEARVKLRWTPKTLGRITLNAQATGTRADDTVEPDQQCLVEVQVVPQGSH